MRPVKRLALLFAGAALLSGQSWDKFSRPPDVANASYGPHERNVVDLWKAKSDKPAPLVIFIHGGGFRAGDKTNLSPVLLDLCLDRGISVAAINYRLTQQAPYPAAMHDGARAVQFLRSKAKEWNLDPDRFGATGGSAGAGISLWVGFHDDFAERKSSDPVKRQSTRLSAMAVLSAQTSYDPRWIAANIGEPAARHPALEPFYALHGEELKSEVAYKLFADASPMTHLTSDDPPAFLFYNEPRGPVAADAKPGTGIHHINFGFALKRKMDKMAIECVVRHADEYPGQAMNLVHRDLVDFFQKHFARGR